jgi:hypothetical protein
MGTILPLLALVASLSLPDRGIWPDLAGQVRIAPPPWLAQQGQGLWLRLDHTHLILTVYQGDTPLCAYPLRRDLAPDQRPRGVSDLLPLLREEEADELRRLAPGGAAVPITEGAPARAEDHDGDGIVDSLDILIGAKKLVLNGAAYHDEYHAIPYPGGDVPRKEGVCTDTVVRALRNAGWDLQREIHEELLSRPAAYPLEKGKRPDANIDHRRVRMLVPWFRRHFTLVAPDAPLRPGDVLFLDTFPRKSGPDHIGIVSDRLGPSGKPLLVNNWTDGYVEQEMDLLAFVPVIYRFRPPGAPRR